MIAHANSNAEKCFYRVENKKRDRVPMDSKMLAVCSPTKLHTKRNWCVLVFVVFFE